MDSHAAKPIGGSARYAGRGSASVFILWSSLFHSVIGFRSVFESTYELWRLVVLVLLFLVSSTLLHLPNKLIEVHEFLGPDLLENFGHHLLDRFGLDIAVQHEKLLFESVFNLRLAHVHHCGVVTEHVDFLNLWDHLGVESSDTFVHVLVFNDNVSLSLFV